MRSINHESEAWVTTVWYRLSQGSMQSEMKRLFFPFSLPARAASAILIQRALSFATVIGGCGPVLGG